MSVRVRSVRCHYVKPRWLFVEVETAEGITGWGEAAVDPWHRTVGVAIEELGETLIGRDALRIEDNWQSLAHGRFYRGGPVIGAAVGAIDTALWDIAGKAAGVPVYELLGGPVRHRVRAYSWITMDDVRTDNPTNEEYAENARLRQSSGMSAVKASYGRSANDAMTSIEAPGRVADIVDLVHAVRDALDPTVDLALDLHGRCSKGVAKQVLRALDDVHLLFVEEPILPEFGEAWREIASITRLPLATGERSHTLADFKSVLNSGVTVLQPDIGGCGGISEMLRIAHLAQQYDATIAPHWACGPIGLAASLQMACIVPNFLIQEQGVDYYTAADFGVGLCDYLTDPTALQLRDGYFPALTRPGIGVDIDRDMLRANSWPARSWIPPSMRTADGSFANW